MGPFENGQPWDTKGVIGTFRFLNRVWNFVHRYGGSPLRRLADGGKPSHQVRAMLNKAINNVEDDIRNMRFNTAVSWLMKLLNELEGHTLSKEEYETFLKLLAPLAPHIAEELWREALGNKESIHIQSWPEYDKKLDENEEVSVAIQINGKLRDVIRIKKGASQHEVNEIAMKSGKISEHLKGKTPVKVIYVPDRVLNIVI
jgi:leucyl-tRNA synthetase